MTAGEKKWNQTTAEVPLSARIEDQLRRHLLNLRAADSLGLMAQDWQSLWAGAGHG